MWYVCTMKVYSSMRKNEVIMVGKVSPAEKEKCTVFPTDVEPGCVCVCAREEITNPETAPSRLGDERIMEHKWLRIRRLSVSEGQRVQQAGYQDKRGHSERGQVRARYTLAWGSTGGGMGENVGGGMSQTSTTSKTKKVHMKTPWWKTLRYMLTPQSCVRKTLKGRQHQL